MDKYKGKYRIQSARAQWWNYGWDAAYFITICTWNRECFFGEIQDDKMVLSAAGRIADSRWQEIPKHAKNLELGPHVVMPNHVHGILILQNNAQPFQPNPAAKPFVETRPALSLPFSPANGGNERKTMGQQRFRQPGKNTISTIVGGYKSGVSNQIHKEGFHLEWQSRFHDHIIRDYDEYNRIANYIINNPANWRDDTFYRE